MSEALPPPASKDYAGPIDQNGWLVEEKYQQFLVNPAAVDESWRALFANGWDRRTAPMRPSRAPTDAPAVADVRPVVLLDRATPERSLEPIHTEDVAPSPAPAHAAAPAPAQVSAPAQVAAEPEGDATKLLRGAPAKLAQNMISSLGVPTATSVHPIPATVLEENRRLINEHLSRSGGKKVSFTHLIAYAILRGLRTVPVLNSTFVPDADGSGTPGVIAHAHVGLGLAIDLEKRGGGRSLVVAAIHDADLLGFTDLVGRYDDIVRRAREGALTADDFSGVTVSITNPGGLGTTQSVPRLMPGQGVIVGIGAIDYPVEFAATDLETLKSLGIGKVVTLTSTYDHRIIQGAESGLFLKRVHELLVGEHGFYEDVFSAIGLAAPPIHLSRDRAAAPPRDNGDARIATLIDAYRTLGHHAARLDPLAEHAPPYPPELDPTYYGLSVFDLGRTFDTGGFFGSVEMTLGEILERLRGIYCGTVGIEYRHIQAGPERAFFQARLESSTIAPTPQQMLRRLNRLERAETFERFLQTRYVGVKRFSGEGGESATVFLDEAFEQATADGVAEAVVGTAHRGRLGILVNIIGKPLTSLFAEFEDNLDPLTVDGSGDVKYHKGGKGTWTGLSGRTLTASLASNPSHLETVDPVVEGIARAQQDLLGEGGESAILPLLIHGDASMAGQGVVAETLNLSLVPAYRTGGTLHLIINNQIGFTTDWQNGRSTKYASDVAKMIEAPILHVNADDPDAVATVARLAVAYRTAFAKDVVVDLVCYRFHGHNEADDPTYTQPVMYRKIASHDSARTIYATKLIELGVLTADEAAERLTAINAELAAALAITRQTPNPPLDRLPDKPFVPMPPLSTPDGVDQKTLDSIVGFLHTTPSGFHLHPKLARQFGQRLEQFDAGEVDWAHGEAMAYATLVLEGTSVRLIGQDAARGTFSHRQAVLSDYETGATYTPLEALARGEVDGLEP
ncbi:MAG TPA: multifunctional oxoglutarate decarboxylase/oxoglutarate dehydrogenase thiamine pyrophosphate-binding subunit/dihydrolipoyllysine-residue succinyltransferase subunit, partial [Acidimicrobiales bacterium]|nr:multifunctional oxoglutarate decarboxylase/oxoglutarate dehydrogenase thiamine pyrophosphate-binding subunit/dihydrolipoyllysine-residue succinyltransferase subunit [Acidimicrobiales bacterium]